MAFNINEIKSQLTFGGAKPSLFQVAISNPINGAGDLKTPFMVQAAQIPEATMGVIEVPYFGRKVKIAGDRTFAEWTVTIINDEDFLIRNAMEEWLANINSHEGNVTQLGAGASEYKAQAQITQYSKTGAPLRTYNFNGLFPTTVGSITTDWGSNDAIETFDVTFAYDWWNVSGGSTGDAGTNA
jgi:hypothetical protein